MTISLPVEKTKSPMPWKNFGSLLGRKGSDPSQSGLDIEIAKLIRVFDCRVNASGSTLIPAELDQRLTNLMSRIPGFSRKDVVLTGLDQLLEICERTPGCPVPELKLGSFKSRGQTSLGFRIPLDLDTRLTGLLRSLPSISKRDVIVAALDLILTQCEALNGGPFSSPGFQPVRPDQS